MKYELQDLKNEYEKLCAEDKLVDYWLEKTNENFQSISNDEQGQYAFLTFNDLKEIKNFEDNQNNYLIIRAAKGATMEIRNSDDNYNLVLQTSEGEIVPYLLSDSTMESQYF